MRPRFLLAAMTAAALISGGPWLPLVQTTFTSHFTTSATASSTSMFAPLRSG